jgi:homoserine O-succinyltransferase/O-acetyltransferase
MSLQNIKDQGNHRAAPSGPKSLIIGLLNLMPDAAFAATEAQFGGLLAAACGPRAVQLELFTLPQLERSGLVLADVKRRYRTPEDLTSRRLDGLIITGTEPRQADLRREPYWAELARVIDWAADNTRSTLFSCLAAHAAVLHLDGIQRRRRAVKLTGVMASAKTGPHPLTGQTPDVWQTPHSRWNDVSEADLEAHHYQVLTRSPEAGADLFVKDVGSQFVFLQGHPEYDGGTLQKEYRRDVRRFLAGETEVYPNLPVNVFKSAIAGKLEALAGSALKSRDPKLLEAVSRLLREVPSTAPWRGQSVQLYSNWLGSFGAAQRDSRPSAGLAMPQ